MQQQKTVNPVKHLMKPVFSLAMGLNLNDGNLSKAILTEWYDKEGKMVELTPVEYEDEQGIFKMINKLFFEHRSGFKALVRFAISQLDCECCDVPIKEQIFELCRTDKALAVWLDECLTENDYYE